jgi:hypothetical protein
VAIVNYNPAIASGIQSATRVMLTSSAGVLATNAAALKFDFTNPASENGFCGYGAITVFGKPSVIPRANLGASILQGSNSFVMNVSGLYPGWSYTLQSTTNLTNPNWSVETNFVPTQSAVTFTNSTLGPAQNFFRVVAN